MGTGHLQEAVASMRREWWDIALDALAFAEAVEALGIQDPITIEFGQPPISDGFYRRDDGSHFIGVNKFQTLRELSRTIWHELEHARQCECMPFDGDGDRYHAEAFNQAIDFDVLGIVGPLEQQAIDAEDYDYDLRLVRMVKCGQ